MPTRRPSYTTKHAKRTSRRVNESTLGTHVQRRSYPSQSRRAQQNRYTQAVLRRARIKRFATIAVIVVVAVGLAVAAGMFVFRNVVGGELSLKDSNAKEALVPVKTGEPSYVLITAELGAVAESLETAGPDVVLLARLDPENKKLALVNVPSSLQLAFDNKSESVASIALTGDAELIKALTTFTKVNISHIVKMERESDLVNLVNALGGVSVDVAQAIDDPHAGSICLPEGEQKLNGEEALVFLRATNITYGSEDRLANQLKFGKQMIADVFATADSGGLGTRIEAIGPYIQTDFTFGDLESINAWLGGVSASDISTAILPGYFTAVTNVTGYDEDRYVSTASEVSSFVKELEDNVAMDVESVRKGDLASPSSFTVKVENGTSIEGAASAAANVLKAAGFKVGDVGNAEQPVYDETLVVYKGDDPEGPARARAVIDAMKSGRAVNGDAYYTFDTDILLIIGADNKPVS